MSVAIAAPLTHTDGYGRHVSYSQVSKNCGLSLRFHREGKKEDHRGISLVYGQAVHEGIEHFLRSGEEAASVEVALHHLHHEIAASERPENPKPAIRWDDPPRLKQNGQLYSGDEAKVPTVEVAEAGVRLQVPAWIKRFGGLSVSALDDIEREVVVPIPGDEDGWTIKCRLDVPTSEGGVVDIKTASKPWKDEEIDSKLDQAHLYHMAYLYWQGQPAEYLTFHVGIKGTDRWEVTEVPFDEDGIERVLEYRVRPQVAAIKAGVYVPNTSGWWHSEKFCEHWSQCPLGAGARGAGWKL